MVTEGTVKIDPEIRIRAAGFSPAENMLTTI